MFNKALSLLLQISLFSLGYLYATSYVSLAQVTPDDTVNTQVNQNGSVAEITGGETRGGNLFHSFQNFSVPTNNTAFFNNTNDISNILSRVTGGDISNIDGLIRANGSANLFLVNPAGIIFGENARLDIGGSFLGTTADSILFEDGIFSATDFNNPPLLSINAPIGLNFRDNPGDIVNSSVVNENNGLEVNTGQNITLLGGNVIFDGGNIFAPGGKVELGGLVSEGTVSFDENNLDFSETATKGNVSLTQGAEVNVRSGNGGFITVNANNLEILNGSAIIAGIGEGLGSPQSQAGNITINVSDKLTLEADANSLASGIFNSVDIDASGNAGDIIINATTVEGNNNFGIGSLTAGQGNAGRVVVNASEISLAGSGGIASVVAPEAIGNSNDIIINTSSLSLSDGAFLATSTLGQGNAGNIQINAANLSLSQGSQINAATFGAGDAGSVTINASDTISADGISGEGSAVISSIVGESAVGNSGGINITTTDLTLTQGAQVAASTFSEGNAGVITINAAGTISADGVDAEGFASGIASTVESPAVGNSGGINITTTDLNLTEGAQVTASTFSQGDAGAITINALGTISADDSNISSTVGESAVGNSGGINITTTDLSLTKSALVIATTFGEGDSGAISINASGTISADAVDAEGDLASGIFSTVESSAEGNSGGINITTKDLSLTQGGVVSGQTSGKGDAGTITIDASGTIFADFRSIISSIVGESAVGNSGGINITTTDLTLTEGAKVVASTFGKGDAGSISIDASGTISADGEDNQGFGSGIISIVGETGKGNAAGIKINSNNLSLSNNAEISVSSEGEGNANDITINTNSLSLDGGASLSATTSIGTGGSINLKVTDTLTLSENSTISAQAFNNANGGNVDINSQFVIASPNQNSDIIASAENGSGGGIEITADGVFGLAPRESDPANETNDLDATSGVGLDGEVSITILETSLFQDVIETPNIVAVEQTTAQTCQANRVAIANSGLTIEGKGGVPPEPGEPLSSAEITVNGETNADSNIPQAIKTSQGKIQPARGIKVTESGEIILTAYRTNNSGERLPEIKENCS